MKKIISVGTTIFLCMSTAIYAGSEKSDSNGNYNNKNNEENTQKSSSIGEYISDSSITATVKSKFIADDDIKSMDISVTTNNGIVELSGNVDSEKQKELAVKIAKNVDGVKSVKNKLMIEKKNKTNHGENHKQDNSNY